MGIAVLQIMIVKYQAFLSFSYSETLSLSLFFEKK